MAPMPTPNINDWSQFSTADLETMLTNVKTSINRILTGAQSATIGDNRSFSMPQLRDLRDLANSISAELRMRTGGSDDFILGEFGSAGPPSSLSDLGAL